MRTVFDWNLGSRTLPLGKRTVIMGVLNVTPDSFSDGGHFLAPENDPEKAVAHALQLLEDGAQIIDVGGESTRPGAKVGQSTAAITSEEELKRVLPVITTLKKQRPYAIISIDTYKATVAQAAVAAGAEIINDVSGFTWDPAMVKTLAALGCGAILMHTRGRPDEWHSLAPSPDIVMQVKRELHDRADVALMAMVKRDRLVLDPGFGFGKRLEENYPLLKRFPEFHSLRYPMLAGVSRKSFVGRALATKDSAGKSEDVAIADRLPGTLAAETALILQGAHIIRTHDVKASAAAAKIADLVA
ncbi:MAG: dihydropteroate synthase [Terriglobales bacterium]|jgi:dihydropteroate synthase